MALVVVVCVCARECCACSCRLSSVLPPSRDFPLPPPLLPSNRPSLLSPAVRVCSLVVDGSVSPSRSQTSEIWLVGCLLDRLERTGRRRPRTEGGAGLPRQDQRAPDSSSSTRTGARAVNHRTRTASSAATSRTAIRPRTELREDTHPSASHPTRPCQGTTPTPTDGPTHRPSQAQRPTRTSPLTVMLRRRRTMSTQHRRTGQEVTRPPILPARTVAMAPSASSHLPDLWQSPRCTPPHRHQLLSSVRRLHPLRRRRSLHRRRRRPLDLPRLLHRPHRRPRVGSCPLGSCADPRLRQRSKDRPRLRHRLRRLSLRPRPRRGGGRRQLRDSRGGRATRQLAHRRRPSRESCPHICEQRSSRRQSDRNDRRLGRRWLLSRRRPLRLRLRPAAQDRPARLRRLGRHRENGSPTTWSSLILASTRSASRTVGPSSSSSMPTSAHSSSRRPILATVWASDRVRWATTRSSRGFRCTLSRTR